MQASNTIAATLLMWLLMTQFQRLFPSVAAPASVVVSVFFSASLFLCASPARPICLCRWHGAPTFVALILPATAVHQVRETGIWEKQSSCWFQAKTAQTTLEGNLCFNLARAGFK